MKLQIFDTFHSEKEFQKTHKKLLQDDATTFGQKDCFLEQEQDKIIELTKIQPKKLKRLDADEILADYYQIHYPPRSQKNSNQKSLKAIKSSKKQFKQTDNQFLITLNSLSDQLIDEFKFQLKKRFVGELQKFRKSCIEKLFFFLCYGYEQIQENTKKQKKFREIEQINRNKKGLYILLKLKTFEIDQKIIEIYLQNEKIKSNFKYNCQWNFIINIIKLKENHLLRTAIITNSISAAELAYADQCSLIDYLPPERKTYLRNQAEKILKSSENDDFKYHFQNQTESQSRQKINQTTSLNESMSVNKFDQEKVVKKRSRQQKAIYGKEDFAELTEEKKQKVESSNRSMTKVEFK